MTTWRARRSAGCGPGRWDVVSPDGRVPALVERNNGAPHQRYDLLVFEPRSWGSTAVYRRSFAKLRDAVAAAAAETEGK